ARDTARERSTASSLDRLFEGFWANVSVVRHRNYVAQRILARAPPRHHHSMPTTLDSPVVQAPNLAAAPTRRDFPMPRPNRALMWALGFVNRWFILRGLPFLRRVPGLRDLPGVRGYLRIRLDLPDADRDRLAAAVNPGTAAFLGPN